MQPITLDTVQNEIDKFLNQDVYLHLETTNGAYASHFNQSFFSVGAYIRNAKVNFERGIITGDKAPYRAGLKIELGWVYAEGLTHWEVNEDGQLLLAGHDAEGKLAVALQLSPHPFE
ncbi:YojF family protein [Fictibacillus enclensis]|uniref:YojF family protein n=1 Tax=Fictibacillus enclensis TaxID=1017270 RepID=UPI0024BF1C99|nr:YojF family protein [Fictibacillus enclensis]WHY73079.1 YojF family protein [Fictibacillus enclensis]